MFEEESVCNAYIKHAFDMNEILNCVLIIFLEENKSGFGKKTDRTKGIFCTFRVISYPLKNKFIPC